jgi:LysM repeat protein
VPPLLVAIVALALAAAVLFALPGLLGFGGPSAVSSPSPSPLASTAAETFAPTPEPAPTPQVYIVQSGDTMSRIAKKFHVALADLIAANAETIPDPNKLQIGDQVTIPVPQPSELPEESPASS